MIYIYTPAWGGPLVWRDLNTAQQALEEHLALTESDNPRWYEHSDRWILTARWRGETAILWKVEI